MQRILSFVFAWLAVAWAQTMVTDTTGYTLIWSDEFNGNSLNLTKWSYEQDCWGGGNGELQCYTSRAKNVAVSNGMLVLTAVHETYTGTQQGCTSNNGGCTNTMQYTSGRIRSLYDPSGSFKYGKFVARMKLPNGYQLWPAFWMLPTDNVYGPWAASGEIDIMEAKGQYTTQSSSALHYGGAWPNNIYSTHNEDWGYDLTNSFHEFCLEWTHDTATLSVDNQQHFQLNLNQNFWSGKGTNPYTANYQPFDQRFHFLFNLAVGGAFFNGEAALTGAQADAWADPTLAVDWLRVYQASTTGTTGTPATTAPVTTAAGTSVNPSSSGSSSGSGNTVTYSHAPTDNVYVRGGAYAAANYVTDSNLIAKYAPIVDYERITFAKFDFSSDNVDTSQVSSCSITLSVQSIAPAVETNGAITLAAYQVLDNSWSEDTLTFANQPALAYLPFDTQVISVSSISSVTFDCSSVVPSLSTSGNVLSVAIEVEAGANTITQFTVYSTRSGNAGSPPSMSMQAQVSSQGTSSSAASSGSSASGSSSSNPIAAGEKAAQSSTSSLDPGVLASIVIGVVAVAILVALIVYVAMRKRRGGGTFKSWY